MLTLKRSCEANFKFTPVFFPLDLDITSVCHRSIIIKNKQTQKGSSVLISMLFTYRRQNTFAFLRVGVSGSNLR